MIPENNDDEAWKYAIVSFKTLDSLSLLRIVQTFARTLIMPEFQSFQLNGSCGNENFKL